MQIEHWDYHQQGELSESSLRALLEGRGYRVQKYVYPPGTYFPDHVHDVDKIDAVLAGRFEINLSGESVVLEAGDMVAVPKGTVHSATVVENESVISLDAVREKT